MSPLPATRFHGALQPELRVSAAIGKLPCSNYQLMSATIYRAAGETEFLCFYRRHQYRWHI